MTTWAHTTTCRCARHVQDLVVVPSVAVVAQLAELVREIDVDVVSEESEPNASCRVFHVGHWCPCTCGNTNTESDTHMRTRTT
jgi:hypothetical protein